MKHKQFMFLVLVFLAAFLAACGGGAASEAAAPQPTPIDVVTHDLYFGDNADNNTNPPTWTAVAGTTSTVTFNNLGSIEHNWAVIKQGAEIPVPFDIENDRDLILYDTGVVQPGATMSFPFPVPDEPGEYIVICTVSGHYPTMQGRLIIK